MRPTLFFLLLSGLAPVILPAQTTLYWDTNGSTIGRALGDGTWSNGVANWTPATAGDIATVNWADGSIAEFYYGGAATNSTLTLGSDISAAGIVADYNPNAITIIGNGHGITLTGTAGIYANALDGLVIDAPIAGSAGLNVTGGYTLALKGTNTYTGLTTVSDFVGLLVYNAASLGATGPGNETQITGNAQVRFMAGVTTAEGFLLNGGSIWVDSSVVGDVTLTGPFVLSYDSILAGNMTNGSVLRLTGVISETGGQHGFRADGGVALSGLNTFTGLVSVGTSTASGPGLFVSDFNNDGVAGPLGAGNGLQLGYSNEGLYNGSVAYTGATTSSTRTIQLVGPNNTISISNPATTLTLSGVISNATFSATNPTLEKAGPGTLELTGNNTYTGDTLLTTGALLVGHSNALGTTGEVVVGTANTAMNDNLTLLLESGVNLGLDVDVANANSGSGMTTLGMTGTGAATYSGSVYISRSITLTADAGGTVNFTAFFTDGGGAATHDITKIGAGQAVFANGIDLRAGGLTINGGEVQLRSSTNLNFFSGGITVHTGGILSGDATVTGGNVLVGNGGVIKPGVNGIGILTVNNLYLGSSGTLHWQLPSLTTSGTPEIVVAVSDGNTELYPTATFNLDLSLLGISQRPDYGTPDPFWQSGHTWLAVDFNGIVAGRPNLQPGYLNPLTMANGTFATGTFSTFIDANGDLNLQFTPVPEPSTYALLGFGGLTLFLPRLRRRA